MGSEGWRTFVNDRDQDSNVEQSTKRISYRAFITSLTNYDKKKYIKLGIGAGVIFLIIIILTAILTSRSNGKNKEQYAELKDYLKLSLLGTSAVSLFDVTSKNRTFYSKIHNVSAYEMYGNKKIFQSDIDCYQITYVNLQDLSIKNVTVSAKVLLEESRFRARDMAYDHIGNNLYAVDEETGILIVINVETTYHSILLSNLITPHHIDIDPYQGIMYILQYGDSILKTKMDGTSATIYFKNPTLSAMTLDRKVQRVYWINEDGIGSADYNMKNRLSFHNIETDYVVDLAVVNDDIFWLALKHHEHNSSITHELLTCKINVSICGNHSAHEVGDLGEYGFIKVSHNYTNENESIHDPCHSNNGGCQHICLVSASEKFRCICQLGWQLNSDGKTCEEVKEFILYTSETIYGSGIYGYFRGNVLDSTRNFSVDVIFPTPYEKREYIKINLNNASIDEILPIPYERTIPIEVNFDYDQGNDNLYYTTGKDIHMVKLKSNQSNDEVIMRGNHFKGIAYDWMTHNLYYLQNKPTNGYKLCVINVGLEHKYDKTLINIGSDLSDDEDYIDSYSRQSQANSLVIHPAAGLIFYYDFVRYFNTSIHVLRASGSELYKVTDSSFISSGKELLTIDNTNQRLYWIPDEYATIIKHANFNGTDVKHIVVKNSFHIKDISVYKNWLYLHTSGGISRVDKLMGGQPEVIKQMPLYYSSTKGGLKIISQMSMKLLNGQEHPCSQGTDNCEQFCFLYESEAVCKCKDDESLGMYGHCI